MLFAGGQIEFVKTCQRLETYFRAQKVRGRKPLTQLCLAVSNLFDLSIRMLTFSKAVFA